MINEMVDAIFDSPLARPLPAPKQKRIKKLTNLHLDALLKARKKSKPRAVKAILYDGRHVEGFEHEGHLAYHDWHRNKRVAKVTTNYIVRKRNPYLEALKEVGDPQHD